MAKRTVNIGSTANDGTGDQLRTAFDKLNQNNDEIYGPDFVTEDMLNDDIVGTDELKVSGVGAAGQILTSNADGTFSWATGVAGDITEIIAGDGLTTPDGTAGDVTLNVVGGTGITVTADEVALATSVQDEITANTLKVGITTAQAGEIVVNNGKFTNANHTGDVAGDGQLTIQDAVVTAAKLDVSNTGADGQILQYNADGTMTWVTGVTGDITKIIATDGLTTPDGESGEVTIGLAAGVAGDGLTLASGVLSVDTIQTGDIEDDAVDGTKLEQFADTLNAGTGGDILVSNGVDFIQATMSGDATIDDTGAITIANDAITTDKILNDAVDADKLADSINADILTGVNKVSFPGFGTTAGTSLEGDTDLLQLGTSSTTALAGDTALLQLGTSGTTALAGDTTLLQLGTSGTTALAGDTALLQVGTLATEALAGNTTTITTDQASKIAANDLKVSNVTHTGDVTDASGVLTLVADKVITSTILDANVTTAKIADANVTTAKILNDNVTHDKLENRYTAINPIGTTSGAFDIDFSLGAVHTATLGGAHTGTFTNFKIGQVIDIIITGNHALTFSATASGTPAINKVGTTAYDGTATQIIQVQCASDDSTTPIFYYACNTYAVDTTP